MIEIMCRDGKVPSKELEKVADMIYYSTGMKLLLPVQGWDFRQ